MNGKKLYIIYAAEFLLYLLFHFIQIQKGLFGQVFFTGILAALFLWAVVFLLLFLVRKIRKKGGVEVVGNPFSASSRCIFHMAGI